MRLLEKKGGRCMYEKRAPIQKGDRLIRFHIRTKGRPREDWSDYCVKKVNKDGTVLLEPSGPDKAPEEIRRNLAKEIIAEIKPILKDQVDQVVEDSLTRLYKEDLEKMKKQISAGEEVKLKSRPGCVYLKIGKTERYL